MSGHVKYLLFVFLLSGNLQMAGSQPPQPLVEEEFPPEMSVLFDGINQSYAKEAMMLVDSMQALWIGDYLSAGRKDTILEAVRILQRNKYKAWPDIGYYYKIVLATSTTSEPAGIFSRWHEALAWAIQTQTAHRSLRFLEGSALFLEQRLLFQSGSVIWKAGNGKWDFELNEDQPGFVFSGIDLTAFAHNDSTVLYNTSGKALLLDDQWQGKGGKLTWQRVMLDPLKVYAQLDNYYIDLKMPSFQADSVSLFFLDFFQQPLKGKIFERILADVKPGEGQFPGFESYEQFHQLNGLFPGINFQGGIALAGAKIIGSGTNKNPARLDFMENDSLFISARALSFSIYNDRIVSDQAAVSLYMAADSIYHQEIILRYNNSLRELSLIRDQRGSSSAPFFNTYHKMDMYCDALTWVMGENHLQMRLLGGIQSAGEAMFESDAFFQFDRYHRLQGMDEVNPLSRLSMFSRQVQTRSFPIEDFARYIRREPSVVKNELLTLSFLGFLTYDKDRQRVTLREKLFHYLSSNVGNSDFDVMRIRSHAPVNAMLDIRNYDLRLMGVDPITLSNDKNVVIYPDNDEIVMQENRNIYFNGQVESGLFNFYGKEFFFEYDDFKINLVNTDSMSFSVRSFEPDSRGRYEYIKVETVLEGINGELLVDHPRNKSGRLPYARYPIFNSNNESFVYFDRDRIKDGIYSRDNIFFKIVPFTIDSLDHASTDNLAFDGMFHSGGIFPEFFDYLRVQTDFSLGFNTHTPEEGFPVYGGQAWYNGPINLSYDGLRTNGNLQYLGVSVDAYNLIMYPDSVSGLAENVALAGSAGEVQFPGMDVYMADVLLLKEEDRMLITSRNDPMVLFDQQAAFLGKMNINDEGLTAIGEISLFDANIVADEFNFGYMDFTSGESLMGIKSRTGEGNSFSHYGYKTFFDMQNYSARFEPANDQAQIFFPSNHLAGEKFNFSWDINNGLIDFASEGKTMFAGFDPDGYDKLLETDFSGYEMYFTNRSKDSLNFYASDLKLDVSDNLIHAQGVYLLRVADAAVFPSQQEVFVEEGSDITKLSNANIIANTINRAHHFYNAEVDIISGSRYEATGLYNFTDEVKSKQVIQFDRIEVGKDNVTLGKAKILPEQEFSISPHFGFMGNIELTASDSILTFDGYSRISVECPLLEAQWFGFRAAVDPFKIFIPVNDELRNQHGDFLAMGIMMAGDSVHIYPGFFAIRRHWSDVKIVSAEGFITYHHLTNEYRVSTLEKLANVRRQEDYLSFNTAECIIQGQGKVNLGSDLGQLSLNSFGTVVHNLKENTVNYDLVLGFDFFFSDEALGIITKSISDNESLELLSMNRPKIITFLQSEMGQSDASPFIGELTLANSFRRLPPPMDNTMFLGDVRLTWNQETRSLLSSGPIGIIHVNKNQVYRYTNGFIELRKQRGGDVLTMIFVPGSGKDEPLGKEWFYFSYSRGVMQTIAARDEYNLGITNLRQRNRQMQVERGQEPFVFILATERRPFDFYEHMRRLLN